MAANQTLTFQSSDGVDITVGKCGFKPSTWRWSLLGLLTWCQTLDRDVAERSLLIKNMLEDLGDAHEAIPIPNVSSPIALSRVSQKGEWIRRL